MQREIHTVMKIKVQKLVNLCKMMQLCIPSNSQLWQSRVEIEIFSVAYFVTVFEAVLLLQ